MKIGLISDIHADLKSLKLALDILQGQQVDTVICAGDLVDKGVSGDAVTHLIRERGIPSVMGNHDYLARADQHWLRRQLNPAHHILLIDETLDYLDQLPLTLIFLWAGKQILLAHGTPASYEEYLFPYSPRALFEQVAACDADIVILGHTHEPMMAYVRDKWIFNPGSVCGAQSDGSGTCATLSLPDLAYRVIEIRTMKRVQPAYLDYS